MVSIFLPTNLNYVLGTQKNRLILIETVLLNTHNICVLDEKLKEIVLQYALLSGGLLN